MMNRYKMQRNSANDGWVCTDIENMIVVTWLDHRYNETQKFSFIEESELLKDRSAQDVAHLINEVSNWLFLHHYCKLEPVPIYSLEYSEDDEHLFLTRNEYPRFRMEIADSCSPSEIASAMKKGAEFIKKLSYRFENNNGTVKIK